ncbi:MAG: electron transfer flavoprotein subunit alpha/FixB family protein [Deltaproteobacteria bacterium]|nr:MAG: electron transfer flavoprotein subunit alpha/FixB family protein [Deltaproteobacteria bacterium]
MSNILVIAEHHAGSLKKGTLAAVTLAKQLAAKVGGGFDFAVIGGGVDGVAAELKGYGAGSIYVVDGPDFADYLAQPHKRAVVAIAEQSGASYIISTAGTTGKDLMPRVAAAIGAGMVADCVGLADGGEVLFKRPMYAGNVIATVRSKTDKTVVSVRTAEFAVAEATGGDSAVVAVSVDAGETAARFVKFDATESERPELTEADFIVTGGRGLKDGPTFWNMLNPLADSLGAAIGATRAVVDSWEEVPNDMQIGQTGKVVAPKLYIAVAVSGAIQHLAGMKNSKTIVAINKDADAPIFQVADYGLVADAFKVLPELTEKVKAARG